MNTRKNVLNELRLSFTTIKNNYKYVKSVASKGEELIASCQWILDNFYLVEKEYVAIKENMPREYFDNLPISKETNNTRILTYAKEFIDKSNECINEQCIINFINSKNDNFKMGELWAFPIMLKISLILKLATVTDKLVDMQKEKIEGKQFAYDLIDDISKNKLNRAVSKLGEKSINASCSFIEELLKVQRFERRCCFYYII